ncbi:hypothetical protein [Halovenus sp. HT40]
MPEMFADVNNQKAPDTLQSRGSLRSSFHCGACIAGVPGACRPLSVPPA